MSDAPYTGVVLATHNSPGPASGLRYDVRLNMPDGTVRELTNVASDYLIPPQADLYDHLGTPPNGDFPFRIVGEGTLNIIKLFIPCFVDSIDCEDLP